jgi:large subunit ribosomal protein L10
MSKALKRYIAADLTSRLGDERDMIVIRLDKHTVDKANDLRSKLRANGSKMTVVRNRVAKHALEPLGSAEVVDLFQGISAIAYGGEDGAMGVSRVLNDWVTSNKDGGIEIVGGFMEGKVITSRDVTTLATMPTRDQLLAMIAATVVAPVQQIAAQVNEMIAGIARAVDAVREKKEQEG